MRQLTTLDAQFLAVESARTYGHVGTLAVYDPATAPGFQINGLKREELIAWNSMILHELYFAGLGNPSRPRPTAIATASRPRGSVMTKSHAEGESGSKGHAARRRARCDSSFGNRNGVSKSATKRCEASLGKPRKTVEIRRTWHCRRSCCQAFRSAS